MRALYATLVVSLLCTCSTPPPNAAELLREMQAALIASDAFRYEFELSTLNRGDEPRRTLHGTAAISRLDLSGGLYLARMQATDVSSEEARPFIATKTEDEVYFADATNRTSYQASMYSAGSQLVARLEPGLMYVFYDPRSLNEEVDSAASWEGTVEIGGVSCELVRVEYPDDPEDSRWCIGRDDKLPRRLEWVEDDAGTRLDLFAIELPGTLGPDDFPLEVPQGYAIEIHRAGPERGAPIPDLTLALAGGGEVRLHDLADEVLVFDFWATWCAPCRASLRSLDSTAAAFADRPVRFFAVNALEGLEPGDPVAFAEEIGLTTEIVLSGDDLHAFFAKGNLPALGVVDGWGRVVGTTIGFHGEGSERYVRQLVSDALSRLQPVD